MDKLSVDHFLQELTELSERYDIKIGGCGCCGSPFLMPLDRSKGTHYKVDDEEDYLEWSS